MQKQHSHSHQEENHSPTLVLFAETSLEEVDPPFLQKVYQTLKWESIPNVEDPIVSGP